MSAALGLAAARRSPSAYPDADRHARQEKFQGEPRLDAMLDDPVVLTLMASDGVSRDELSRVMMSARVAQPDASWSNTTRIYGE